MPAAIIPAIITAGASAGAAIYGANKQSQATQQATQATQQANDKAIALERQQLAQQQAQFNAQQQFAAAQYNAQQERLAPYRAAGAAALQNLSKTLGFTYDPSAYQPQPYTYTPPGATSTGTPSTSTPSQTSGPTGTPSSFGNLSSPATWMGLVGNPTQLTSWVKSVAPSLNPQLVSYYVQKIQGQPGANPTEQAGSAQYWAQKILSDPTLGGASGGGTSAPTSAGTGLPPVLSALAPTIGSPSSYITPNSFQPNYQGVIPLSAMVGR